MVAANARPYRSPFPDNFAGFWVVGGEQQKSLAKPFIPLQAFVWALYRLRETGVSDKAIVEADEFRLFLLAPEDVKILLSEATRAGYISFRAMGDIYDLSFRYASLQEVVDEFTAQVL